MAEIGSREAMMRGRGLQLRAGVAGLLMALWLAGTAPTPAAAAETPQETANRQMVIQMWQEVIVKLDDAAARKYIAPDYIQHNPNVGPGRQGLLDAMARTRGGGPHSIKRLIHSFAKDDLVVLVWDRDLPEPGDPSKIYTNNAFDMFRVKDGVVVEHWDDNAKNPKGR
jgi:predicted SnoaL-like aldol condensation-catalyzing enzyme